MNTAQGGGSAKDEKTRIRAEGPPVDEPITSADGAVALERGSRFSIDGIAHDEITRLHVDGTIGIDECVATER